MRDLLAPRWARQLVQLSGTVRKELLDVLRQPALVALLVLGPFLVLVAFGAGYDQNATELRTAFVGPQDAVYEEAIAERVDSLERYVDSVGYSSDVIAAQQRVEDGEIDLVVQFPPDASEAVLGGEQAIINVFHEKLDPIQVTTVEISAQVAVLELNAAILERILGEAGGGSVEPVDEGVSEVDARVDAIREAVDAGDLDTAREEAGRLETALGDVDQVSRSSVALAGELGGDLTDDQAADVEALSSTTASMADTAARIRDASSLPRAEPDVQRLEADREQLREQSQGVVTLGPAVLTRPFRTDAESLQREDVSIQDFFAPNSIALLLAHLALTIAAMGLMRSRNAGLLELFRVGPMGTRTVLAGTYTSFLLIGAAVAALLIGATVGLLGVPLRGDVVQLVAPVLLLLAGSIGLGLVVALVSSSDTQAVQWAMLVLLAGLFFGGFFLDLDLFRWPVRVLATVLPVTHGISTLQDVMLRGDAPAVRDLVGLGATTLGYGLLAATLLRRRLRIESGEAA